MSKRNTAVRLPEYGSLFFSKVTDFLDVFLLQQAGKSQYTRKSYKTDLSFFYPEFPGIFCNYEFS